jgi:hypothetical protein
MKELSIDTRSWWRRRVDCWLTGCYQDYEARAWFNRNIGGQGDGACARCGAPPGGTIHWTWFPGGCKLGVFK